MRKFLHFTLALVAGLFFSTAGYQVQAQTDVNNDDRVFTVVEQMPQYPGGDQALYTEIAKNLKYPEKAKEQGIEGRLFVSFIIDKQGQVYNAKVEKGLGNGLDEEALRVVSELKGWTPAKQAGRPVNYKYIMPIKFRLDNVNLGPTGQTKPAAQPVEVQLPVEQISKNPEGDMIFVVVEQLPQYPGGEQALYSEIARSIKYPAKARKQGIEGRVFVSFIIDKQGQLNNPKVEKGLSPDLDEEAIRVISTLKGWTPAKQAGQAVNYKYVLPIKFKLETPGPVDGK